MTAESRLRLAPKTDIGANSWRLEMPDHPEVQLLVVGDDITEEEGWPRHRGLVVVAEAAADDIDMAMNAAKGQAEVVATFLAVAAKAAVAPIYVQLAYEITPGASARAWRRIYWESSIPANKRAVSDPVFTTLWDYAFNKPMPPIKDAKRVMLSMSRYRVSLEENDGLARFLQLWIAVEAIAPRVADHFDIKSDQGWQGLRQLAEQEGLNPEPEGDGKAPKDLVSRALDVRRPSVHAGPTSRGSNRSPRSRCSRVAGARLVHQRRGSRHDRRRRRQRLNTPRGHH